MRLDPAYFHRYQTCFKITAFESVGLSDKSHSLLNISFVLVSLFTTKLQSIDIFMLSINKKNPQRIVLSKVEFIVVCLETPSFF